MSAFCGAIGSISHSPPLHGSCGLCKLRKEVTPQSKTLWGVFGQFPFCCHSQNNIFRPTASKHNCSPTAHSRTFTAAPHAPVRRWHARTQLSRQVMWVVALLQQEERVTTCFKCSPAACLLARLPFSGLTTWTGRRCPAALFGPSQEHSAERSG